MKITIELTEAQVKGIKEYLREVCDIAIPKKDDIIIEVKGIVNGYMQAQHNSLADYVMKYENN